MLVSGGQVDGFHLAFSGKKRRYRLDSETLPDALDECINSETVEKGLNPVVFSLIYPRPKKLLPTSY